MRLNYRFQQVLRDDRVKPRRKSEDNHAKTDRDRRKIVVFDLNGNVRISKFSND